MFDPGIPGRPPQSRRLTMTDAQAGLLVAAPAIMAMAGLLYRMGVLQKGGAVAAVVASLLIAMVLFFEQ